jgi:hypothetical protein
MAKTYVRSTGEAAKNVQQQYLSVTDQVPEEVWYWAAITSILASATLFLLQKRDWSIFVGQWPPTFLLLALFHKVLRPSRS